MNKIIITGGSGFTGKYVIDELYTDSQLLVIGTNNKTKLVTTLEGNQTSYKYTDYSYDNLMSIFEVFKPDAVIHLAAERPIKNKNEKQSFIPNLNISLNLFEVCLAKKVKNIVNISSKSVYSEKNKLPWEEADIPIPSNAYGLSKVWVENAATYYNCLGLYIKTLRLSQVIGLGERKGYVLQTYLDNAIAGKPLKVFGKNLGKRQYIYVKDVSHAVNCALNNKKSCGIYNISMLSNYSFMDLAQCINRVFNNNEGIEHLDHLSSDESSYKLSITKAQDELGWKPKYNLEGAYKDMYTDLKIIKDETK